MGRPSVVCMCLIALLPAMQVAEGASLQCGALDTNGNFIAYGLADGAPITDCPSDQQVWRNDESPFPSLTLGQGVEVGGASFLFIGFCWAMAATFNAINKVS